jgi:hypothetical protein
VSALYEDALVYETGSAITSSGALTAYSGSKTGRSPLDKRVVKEESSEKDVWWGPVNKPMSPEVSRTTLQLSSFLLSCFHLREGCRAWSHPCTCYTSSKGHARSCSVFLSGSPSISGRRCRPVKLHSPALPAKQHDAFAIKAAVVGEAWLRVRTELSRDRGCNHRHLSIGIIPPCPTSSSTACNVVDPCLHSHCRFKYVEC